MRSIFFIFSLLITQACGVYSFTGASISPEVETLSVAFFPNQANLVNPTLSQTFTEALKDQFIQQTNLNLITKGGDLHFEGEIVDYSVRPVSVTSDQTASQNRLTITVNVRFFNSVSPEKDFQQRFSRFSDFPSSENIASIEDQLVEEITQELVQNIFNKAVVNW